MVAKALGEPVRPGPVHADMDFAPNTNLIGHAGRTWALVEAGARPYELTYDLDTVGPSDFGGTLPGGYTAHPKRDPATGELHAVSYFWGWGNRVQYSVVGTDGRVRRVVDVEVGAPVMVHDLSLTARYAVIYDLPVVFSMEALSEGAMLPYRWAPGYPARVGLLPREGTGDDVRWFEIEPCYVFHPLNAYDHGEQVVLDVVRHPRMFATHLTGPDEGTPVLQRWTVDPSAGKVLTKTLDDRGQEFPRVDERVVGARHRYGYAVTAESTGSGGVFGEALLKHDLERGTTEARVLGAGRRAGEAVFVPRDAHAAEDDGWAIALAHGEDATDLLVLNAADFTGEPQAVVHIPARVPLGFHGNWVPDRG